VRVQRAFATSLRARSASPQPRRCATPCSVTIASTSARAVVTGRPSSDATIRECRPSGVVDGNAMIERPPGDALPQRTKSGRPPTAPR
jgi:hypothetical protein